MNDTTSRLLQGDSVWAHLKMAKQALETNKYDLRPVAEHIAKARQKGASPKLIAVFFGESAAWVKRLLRWHKSEYRDDALLEPQSRARHAQAEAERDEDDEYDYADGDDFEDLDGKDLDDEGDA
jgi:hypothetical protein